MAINEKIRESITIQSAWHSGGVRIKEKILSYHLIKNEMRTAKSLQKSVGSSPFIRVLL
jgi:hypothetical protein